MNHKIEIREILSRIVTVNAENKDDATDIVRQQYANEEIVLGASDYDDVEFEVTK